MAIAIVVAVGMLAGVMTVVVRSLLVVAQRAALPRTAALVDDDTASGEEEPR